MPGKSRVLPSGECWCGCEAEVPIGKFFVSGHDRRAESWLIRMEYGGVAEFLAAKGYAPAEKNLGKTYRDWLRKEGR